MAIRLYTGNVFCELPLPIYSILFTKSVFFEQEYIKHHVTFHFPLLTWNRGVLSPAMIVKIYKQISKGKVIQTLRLTGRVYDPIVVFLNPAVRCPQLNWQGLFSLVHPHWLIQQFPDQRPSVILPARHQLTDRIST